jgi:hypothetical protein
MKAIGLNWTWPTTVLAIVFLAVGSSNGADTIPHGRQDIEAKVEYARPATDCPARAITAISPCRGWRDSSPDT